MNSNAIRAGLIYVCIRSGQARLVSLIASKKVFPKLRLLFHKTFHISLSYHCIKKSPINTGFIGLFITLYYLGNPRLANSLCFHCVNNFLESSNVCSYYVVAFEAVLLSSVSRVVADIYHDVFQFCVNFLEGPAQTLAVL